MHNPMSSELIQQLASENCVLCNSTDGLSRDETIELLRDLPGWQLVENSIQKEFRFKSYKSGLDFAYEVGKIAEEQDHHPDIWIGWRRVKLTFSTHAIKGLSRNDFIMAAKVEQYFAKTA